MNIAFCINHLGLVGLQITLISLVRNCSDSSRVNLYFLCNRLSEETKERIKICLKNENFGGRIKFIDFDPELVFGSFRSLHGDYTTYGRLLLADVISDDKILYLDADLVIELDILELDEIDLDEYALAAVEAGPLKNALEKDFYLNKCSLLADTPSFNAGVLLFNLKKWRSDSIRDNCLQLAKKFPDDLLSCDQSILNALFAGKFLKLQKKYNSEWYSHKPKPAVASRMILHFVGSPKPWDFLGSYFHNGYGICSNYINRRYFDRHMLKEGKRIWEIRRSYVRALLYKYRLL